MECSTAQRASFASVARIRRHALDSPLWSVVNLAHRSSQSNSWRTMSRQSIEVRACRVASTQSTKLRHDAAADASTYSFKICCGLPFKTQVRGWYQEA